MAADDRPVLITDVGESPQAEFARRKRRYGVMMGIRVLCVIAAFVVGSVFHDIWIALALIAAAAVLPWAAVLIANDRLPKAERARMAQTRVEQAAHERALTNRSGSGYTPHGGRTGANTRPSGERSRVIDG